MEDLDEFEGGEEVDYDFNLDEDLPNETEETTPAEELASATPTISTSAAAGLGSAVASTHADVELASIAAAPAEPSLLEQAAVSAAELEKSAAPGPGPPKPQPKGKHKFTGLEDLEGAGAAPAAYQPPSQEQLMAERLQKATALAREQQRMGMNGGLGRPFQPSSQSGFRGGGRVGGRSGPANGRPASGGPRLPDRRLGEGRGRGGNDAQRGGRGMPARDGVGAQGRGVGRGRMTGRGIPPVQHPQDGRQLMRPPPRGPAPPRGAPPRGPLFPGSKLPTPAAGMGPQRGLNPSATPFLPMPPGLPMPNGMSFDPSVMGMGGLSMKGMVERMQNGRDFARDGGEPKIPDRLLGRISGRVGDWGGQKSGPWGNDDGSAGTGRKIGRESWEAGGRQASGDLGYGSRGGPPKLVGDFDAGEEFEPPKKRPVPDIRGFGGLGGRPGLAPPPRDGPKMPPTAAELEAEKARKRQEEEEARKAAIQRRIEAQKEENALLARLRELERQVELNKIRDSIARLEAEQAKSLKSSTPTTEIKPALKAAPVPQKAAEAKADPQPGGATKDASQARRLSGGREDREVDRSRRRSRSPVREIPAGRSQGRRADASESSRYGVRARPRVEESSRRNEESSRYSDSRGNAKEASQDLREYLEQKKQRARRPDAGDDRQNAKWGRRG